MLNEQILKLENKVKYINNVNYINYMNHINLSSLSKIYWALKINEFFDNANEFISIIATKIMRLITI